MDIPLGFYVDAFPWAQSSRESKRMAYRDSLVFVAACEKIGAWEGTGELLRERMGDIAGVRKINGQCKVHAIARDNRSKDDPIISCSIEPVLQESTRHLGRRWNRGRQHVQKWSAPSRCHMSAVDWWQPVVYSYLRQSSADCCVEKNRESRGVIATTCRSWITKVTASREYTCTERSDWCMVEQLGQKLRGDRGIKYSVNRHLHGGDRQSRIMSSSVTEVTFHLVGGQRLR